MEHYHTTDIQHSHSYSWGQSARDFGLTDQWVGAGQSPMTMLWASDQAIHPVFTINNLNEYEKVKGSSGSLTSVGTPRQSTDSNNTSATETRPTNFTVKIWKRTD